MLNNFIKKDGGKIVGYQIMDDTAPNFAIPEGFQLATEDDDAVVDEFLNSQQLEFLLINSLQEVDDKAEHARLKFITPGAGQAMVYQRKTQEAETLELDASPNSTNYPLLSAEIGITGATISEIAVSVLAQRDSWLIVAAQIERIRLLAKAAIRTATTKEQIDLVLADLPFPKPE